MDQKASLQQLPSSAQQAEADATTLAGFLRNQEINAAWVVSQWSHIKDELELHGVAEDKAEHLAVVLTTGIK